MSLKRIAWWALRHFFDRIKDDMLDLKPYRREIKFFCGPASLKIVLDYYGVSVPEQEIAKAANATREKGASAKGLVKAAEYFGFNAFFKEDSTLDDLRYYLDKKIPVIVDWFWEDDGHYGVVIGIDKKNIIFRDPSLWKIKKMPLTMFEDVWFDFTGKDRKREHMVQQLIIVVTPKNNKPDP